MASIFRESNGRKRIDFARPDGSRPRIRLGKKSMPQAELARRCVEDLLGGGKLADETTDWLGTLDSRIYRRLVKAIPDADKYRNPVTAVAAPVATLRKLYDEFFAVLNVKKGTLDAYKQGAGSLIAFFGDTTPLSAIDALAIDKWLQSLRDGELAGATVAKRTQTAKRMFQKAVRWKMVSESPLIDVKIGSQKNKARQFFITRDVAQKVLDACPDAQWRLLFALSRFGGLRCPSEHLALKWGDVDFGKEPDGRDGRIRVTSPKTAHHERKDTRLMPLFPELRKPLLDVFTEAAEGTEYVITRYRSANSNLRTQLERIMRRAGVDSWPRLFQNLRASRATELAAEFPSHVAAAWLGHSEEIADAHYRQVLDSDFAKAAAGPSEKAAQKVTQTTPDNPGQTQTAENAESDKTPENKGNPALCAVGGGDGHGRGRIRTFEGRAIRFTV